MKQQIWALSALAISVATSNTYYEHPQSLSPKFEIIANVQTVPIKENIYIEKIFTLRDLAEPLLLESRRFTKEEADGYNKFLGGIF